MLAVVLTLEPEWTALPRDTPSSLRRLLERCLERNPKQRLRDVGEARITLASPRVSGTWETYVQPFPDGGRRWQVSTGGGEGRSPVPKCYTIH